MNLMWLLMVGPIYVGLVMGYLHPHNWFMISISTVVCCILLGILGRYVK